MKLKVLIAQTESQQVVHNTAKERNLDRIVTILKKKCIEHEPDLIVLPELSTIAYSLLAFKNIDELAENVYGSTYKKMSLFAKEMNVNISYGFPRKYDNKKYISQATLDRTGRLLSLYDKIHLAQFGASDEDCFTEGKYLSIFTINDINIGVVICYDFRFPEYIRGMVKRHDLQVVLHPSAFTRDKSFESWHHFVVTRALENQVYFLSINRAGKDWGKSILCPPWVDDDIRATILGDEEEFVVFEIDKKRVRESRKSYPFYADSYKSHSNLEIFDLSSGGFADKPPKMTNLR